MISSIEWVPAGVADPNPKKYEFSQAELDLIKMMENHTVGDDEGNVESKDSNNDASSNKKTKTKLPIMENNLPADLRMDEYSSDEDENEAARGAAIGRLLVEDDEEEVEEPQNDQGDEDDNDDDMENDSDDDDDSDDDLADVPDTREYMPVDVDGLNAIGFSQVGTNAPAYLGDDDDDDDGSDAEDVKIRATDSLVVVAKTEEVRIFDWQFVVREPLVLVIQCALKLQYVYSFVIHVWLGVCIPGGSRLRTGFGKSICPSRHSPPRISLVLEPRRHWSHWSSRKLLCRWDFWSGH